MRVAVAAVVAVLASTLTVAPAEALDEPSPSYCLSIQELTAQKTASTCSHHDDAPRPVARVHQTLTTAEPKGAAVLRLCAYGYLNLGRFRVTGIGPDPGFRVRYTRSDGVDITSAVVAGTYVTRRIVVNECFRYRITVTRTSSADPGDLRTFSLTADPEGPGWATLRAATHVTAG